MSDLPEEQKPNGFFSDPRGNKSSGRVAKILALVTAIFVAVIGLTIAGFGLFTPRPVGVTTMMDATTFVGLVLGLVGSFLSVVLGTEITQKTTNK
jgi:hypothetical protein